jgi:hypothetical protein
MKKIILPLLLLVLMFDLSAFKNRLIEEPDPYDEVEEAINTLSLVPAEEENLDTGEESEDSEAQHISAINDFLAGDFNSKLSFQMYSKEGKIVLGGAVLKNVVIMGVISSNFLQLYWQFFSQTFAEIIRLNPSHFNLEEGKLTLSGIDDDFDIGPLYSEGSDFLIGIRMLMNVHGGERDSLADGGGFSFQPFLQLLDPNSLGTLIEDPAAFSPEDDGEYADIGSIVVAVDECPITALLVKVKKGLIYTAG